jgi:lysyl-tRNA synthetase class 2
MTESCGSSPEPYADAAAGVVMAFALFAVISGEAPENAFRDSIERRAAMTETPTDGAADNKPSPWWSASRRADLRPFLAARNAITKATRAWFDEQGFTEVETAILQVSPGNETHLHAPRTELTAADGSRMARYLRTSPEFACKKLLAAGETRIFEFARVFRDRERSRLHLPEFTMLEWYRANEAYDAVMADSVVLIAHAAQATGIGQFSFRGRVADPFAEPEMLTVARAFERFAGIDLLATIDGGEGDRTKLAAAAGAKIRIAADDSWSDIFSKVLVEYIEPNLGQGRLTLLYEYPLPEAALAREASSDARVAERFEIYACGVELANGFGELTDATELRLRFTLAMDEKQRRYGERYPLDEDFLAAMACMPPASGVALGFDRLVMLASGATAVDQVVWTPP